MNKQHYKPKGLGRIRFQLLPGDGAPGLLCKIKDGRVYGYSPGAQVEPVTDAPCDSLAELIAFIDQCGDY